MSSEASQALSGGASFPTTLWSDVLAAGDADHPSRQARLEALLRRYWRPVYAYVRASWRRSPDDAADLTQAFFARLLEKGWLERLRQERGSFRGYLKRAVQHFLIDAQRAERARRPATPLLSLELDPAALERLGALREESPEQAFDREWGRTLLEAGIEDLRRTLAAAGKEAWFEVFRRYCVDPASAMHEPAQAPSYREVGESLGLSESDVRNRLRHCRVTLRALLRARVRDTVESEADVERELLAVLG